MPVEVVPGVVGVLRALHEAGESVEDHQLALVFLDFGEQHLPAAGSVEGRDVGEVHVDEIFEFRRFEAHGFDAGSNVEVPVVLVIEVEDPDRGRGPSEDLAARREARGEF